MRLNHENLRKDHHSKHRARIQYILFLQIIGVSLEDVIHFLKIKFTTKKRDIK